MITLMLVATPGAWAHRHGQKARVYFLATGTLVRGSWGQNQDTYLAQLFLPKQKAAVLVRVVDTYPSPWPPLSRDVLLSDNATMLSVTRDSSCDRSFGEMVLRTAPGDPLAILPERLGYQPRLDPMPTPGSILPCYRVLRQ